MIDIKDIYWAAGFVEGEGCFLRKHWTTSAGQKQREPLERLQCLFGGALVSTKYWNGYLWAVYGKRSIGVMMTLYPLMSPWRKEKIRAAIQEWKNGPGMGANRIKNKKEILADYDGGARTIRSTAKKYSIGHRTLCRWLKERRATGSVRPEEATQYH
jgi:hypothetical protein